MNNLQFVAELVKALAWPIAAVALALVFRKSLIELLGRINKGKIGWAELEFETQVVQLAKEVPMTKLAPATTETPGEEDAVLSDPRGTVLTAWRDIEIAVRNFARQKRIVYASTLLPPFSAVEAFEKKGVLESQYISLLKHLGELRNQAAHQRDFVPSADSVSLYLRLAEAFKAALKKAEG